jgi:homoserine kinase type II
MVQYITLQDEHIQEISNIYNQSIIDYQSIEAGAGNTNYVLRTVTGQYILTIFEIEYRRVVNLSKLMQWLEAHDFPASQIQKSTAGELVTRWRGKPMLLKHFIPGRVVENLDSGMLAHVGAAVAQLHAIPAPEFLPTNHPYGFETFSFLLDKEIDIDYEAWLAERMTSLTRTIKLDLPRGLIHGDVFYDNILFEGQNLTAIIDFEEACYDFNVFDLGMAIVGTCLNVGEINLAKTSALVQGYQNHRVLTYLEKETLKSFVEYAAIATSSWRFWKYNIDTPLESLGGKHWEMVAIAERVNAFPNQEFVRAVFA